MDKMRINDSILIMMVILIPETSKQKVISWLYKVRKQTVLNKIILIRRKQTFEINWGKKEKKLEEKSCAIFKTTKYNRDL